MCLRRAHHTEKPAVRWGWQHVCSTRERPDFPCVTTDVIGRQLGGTIVFDLKEILMWTALKKAVAGVTESLGIEIPGLPIDLGAVGDAAATAAQGVTESANGAVEGLTGVTETLSGSVAGVTDSVAGAAEGVSASAVDSAAQALPDVTAAVGSANPSK